MSLKEEAQVVKVKDEMFQLLCVIIQESGLKMR